MFRLSVIYELISESATSYCDVGCMTRKHLSTIIVVGILFAAVIFTSGCTSTVNNTPTPSVASPTRDPTFVPKNTSGYLTYSNRSAGISIQYPSSWQKNETAIGEVVSFNTSGLPGALFTVFAPQNFSGAAVTLDDFSNGLLPTSLTEFKLLNSTDIALSGYPAHKHIFSFMNDDESISQGMLQLTIVNRTGYALLYVTTQSLYPSYLGIVQNMTQSFNVTK